MKQSEKVLMGITIVTVAGYLLYTAFGDSESPGSGGGFFGVPSAEVEQARRAYERTVASVAESPRIVRQFTQLAGEDAMRSLKGENTRDLTQSRPDLEFTSAVADWCREAGFPAPDVSKRIQDIRTRRGNQLVLDYQLVVVTINIREGDLTRISQLLKTFEQKGLIIQEVDLAAARDSNRLSAMIVVAKLVDYFYPTREQKQARS
jgi:hypothetical protein